MISDVVTFDIINHISDMKSYVYEIVYDIIYI